MPEYTFQWVNKPPIEKIKPEQVEWYAEQLAKSIDKWLDCSDPATWDQSKKPWERQVRNARSIAGIARGSQHQFVYKVTGVPVGLLVMTDGGPSDPPYICDLIGHPGVENAGSILLEYAVNLSEAMGAGGELELFSYDDLSTGFYLAMGLDKKDQDPTTGGTMTLNPSSKRDVWERLDTGWRLKKYANLNQYLKTTKPLPPVPRKPLPPTPTKV